MNNYEVFWHVKDNPETLPHNDNMLVCAENYKGAAREFCERIRNEFDYDIMYVDYVRIHLTGTYTYYEYDVKRGRFI